MMVLGKKKAMTQVIRKYRVVPVTVLDITESVVAGKRELEDGRKALLIGYGKKKRPNKPETGQFKELGYVPEKVVQVIVDDEVFEKFNIGDKLNDLLEVGQKVDVQGLTKGKGFTGVVKRWGFRGGPKTHGQSDRHRAIGAIGAQTPGRVLKGKKMAGRSGNALVTVKNLEIMDKMQIDDRVYLILKGSVPGAYNKIVTIKLQ